MPLVERFSNQSGQSGDSYVRRKWLGQARPDFSSFAGFAADALNVWVISGVCGHVNDTRTAYKVNFSGMATEFWTKW